MAERAAAPGVAVRTDAIAGTAGDQTQAGAGARILAYLIDSVVLFCFSVVFLLAATLVLFLDSDQGRDQITDAEAWAFVAILTFSIPVWLIAAWLMSAVLAYTPGQYVMGLRLQTEDASPPGRGRLLLYWLALHPLVFHPLFAGVWFLLAYVGISLAESDALFVLGTALGLLCLVTPLVGLVFMLSDPQRRTIHDRLVGMRVQRLQ
jgi:uncharacterized RDD family membrane protein YckC